MPRLLPTPAGGIVGGSAANCVSLALQLTREGADVRLLAPVSPDAVNSLAQTATGAILKPLPAVGRGLIGRGLRTLGILRRGLRNCLRETHFDVVHSHSGTYPYGFVPLVADARTSVRVHSLYCPLGAKGGVYSRWWERAAAARLALGRLDRIIAVTANVRRSLEDAGLRPEKIDLAPMCVDAERFHPRPRPANAVHFPDSGGDPRILFVGNASKEKGLLALLEAVKLLKERHLAVSLVAAVENQCGIKEYDIGYEQARTFIRHADIERQVRFTGLLDSVETAYAECDVLVIPWNTSRGPSDYPMVVLEAMAMGKCVVSTPVGGCCDLLEHGKAGILTDGFTSQAIAAGIERAARDPALRTRVEQAARSRAQDFSLANSARQLLALYEGLLRTKEQYRG